MGLTVYLFDPTATYEVEPLFELRITHNLGKMAEEAGLYLPLWRPEEGGYKFGKDIEPLLEEGLSRLIENPEHYSTFNPSNGWGTYSGLVSFAISYLQAIRKYPEARIEACR